MLRKHPMYPCMYIATSIKHSCRSTYITRTTNMLHDCTHELRPLHQAHLVVEAMAHDLVETDEIVAVAFLRKANCRLRQVCHLLNVTNVRCPEK